MALNPMALMQIMQAYQQFKTSHPKFPAFLKAANDNYFKEGSIIDITITNTDGQKISSNLKITANDLELISKLKQLN